MSLEAPQGAVDLSGSDLDLDEGASQRRERQRVEQGTLARATDSPVNDSGAKPSHERQSSRSKPKGSRSGRSKRRKESHIETVSVSDGDPRDSRRRHHRSKSNRHKRRTDSRRGNSTRTPSPSTGDDSYDERGKPRRATSREKNKKKSRSQSHSESDGDAHMPRRAKSAGSARGSSRKLKRGGSSGSERSLSEHDHRNSRRNLHRKKSKRRGKSSRSASEVSDDDALARELERQTSAGKKRVARDKAEMGDTAPTDSAEDSDNADEYDSEVEELYRRAEARRGLARKNTGLPKARVQEVRLTKQMSVASLECCNQYMDFTDPKDEQASWKFNMATVSIVCDWKDHANGLLFELADVQEPPLREFSFPYICKFDTFLDLPGRMEDAGARLGDFIVGVNGEVVENMNHVNTLVERSRAYRLVKISLRMVLPARWQVRINSSGQLYYEHVKKGKQQYRRPFTSEMKSLLIALGIAKHTFGLTASEKKKLGLLCSICCFCCPIGIAMNFV